MINIVPNNDKKEHVEDSTCHCLPRATNEDGELIVIHNSYDGRELLERIENEFHSKK